MSGTSYRVDETYVKVGKAWKYLYRAVDKECGRLLCLLLALYGFAMFGYVTATLATFFVGRDAESEEAEVAGAKQIAELKTEVAQLRVEMQAVLMQLEQQNTGRQL